MVAPCKSNMRRVVVHYHIFKNAGSSVDRFLQQNFGASWTVFEGSHATDIQPSENLESFLYQHPEIRAVSSHLVRPPLPRGFHVVPIVFIRHPLDRVESVYQFLKRDPNQRLHEFVKAASLADFVKWALNPKSVVVVIRNYQTIHLSGASFRGPHIYDVEATSEDLREALDFLESIPAVGVVDKYAISLRMFAKLIGEQVAPVMYNEYRENVSPGSASSLEARLEKLRLSLPADLWKRLTEENSLDMELYDFACHQLARRS